MSPAGTDEVARCRPGHRGRSADDRGVSAIGRRVEDAVGVANASYRHCSGVVDCQVARMVGRQDAKAEVAVKPEIKAPNVAAFAPQQAAE